jgi:DNA-binding IclR family transcriptional regulator
MPPNQGLPVQATQTSYEIITTLLSVGGAGVTEIATEIGKSKSSVHNHLETLVGLGLVSKHQTKYRVSLKWLQFGSATLRDRPIYRIGVPEVIQLSEASGCSTGLAVLENQSTTILYHRYAADIEKPDRIAGDTIPLHCTAAGKAIFASLSSPKQEELLDTYKFEDGTDAASTTPSGLKEESETIQSQGIAIDREEWRPNQAGLAASINVEEANQPAAIYIRTKADDIGGKRFQQDLPGLLISSANQIRTALHDALS